MKRTALHGEHAALGARFVEFGGWEMPVQYTSILEEHAAVRQQAGLFDVSHMGQVELRGPRALADAQLLTTNDVARLGDGEAQYSLLCRPDGGVVDDIIVYRLTAERLLLCINAGNTDKDLAWIREHARQAEVIDRSAELSLLAVQGPRATDILEKLTEAPLAARARFSCHEGRVAGVSAILARTGYTGEDGWEIYVGNEHAPRLWREIREAGAEGGLLPAGLGARDTLRLEAALPLYGHELAEDITPLEAGLGWAVRLDKGEFLGRDALARQKEAGVHRRLVGLEVLGAGIPRQGYPLWAGGERVGEVTSGTKSPTLGTPLGLGYVAASSAAVGSEISVEIRGRQIAGRVVRKPFYRRQGQGG